MAPEVVFVDDVIAVEDASCLMSAHRHGDPLRYSCSHPVSYRRSPQVMKELPGDSSFLARRSPGFFEISNLNSLTVKHSMDRSSRLPLPFNNVPEFSMQYQHPPVLCLGGVGSQSSDACLRIYIRPL